MMYYVLLILICFINLMALSSSHPVNLAGLLMMSSLFMSVYIYYQSSSWLFYLLILMFLGGVMVIITYMTSLAANEKLYMTSYSIKAAGLPLFLIMWFMMEESFKNKLSSNFLFSASVYEVNFLHLLLGCFLALLLSMISVIKLMKLEEGPLVKRL